MAVLAFRKKLFALFIGFALANLFLVSRFLHVESPVRQPPPSTARAVVDGTPIRRSPNERWIVITSIQAPTPQVLYLCALPDWTTLVVADAKTPLAPWQNATTGCLFLSLAEQAALDYRILQHLPENNYGRKNVGYLYAIQHGAREIYETDDDNQPAARAGGVAMHRTGEPVARLSGREAGMRVQNPYAFFGLPDLWPRGYPLRDVNRSREPRLMGCPDDAPLAHAEMEFPVQQGIVDLDADVDAIFRMTHAPYVGRIKFRTDRVPVSLARGTYCPYNTQNTLSRYKAFWGLFVPVTTTMRVCDIWRSYWVQRVLWDIGEELLFLPATAEQVRNPHDFQRDFIEELDLYTKVDDLIALLDQWNPTAETLFERLRDLGHRLADHAFWGRTDALLMDAWLDDLLRLGYSPPRIVPQTEMLQDLLVTERGCAPPPFPPQSRFALFVRTFSEPKHVAEFWRLVRSLDLFFPGFRRGQYELVVVLDEESVGDRAFGANITASIPSARVHYEAPCPAQYRSHGHVRQQWSMFWSDNYTQADFIGMIDTDVLFTTPVTRDLLFDAQGRPRVKGVFDRRAVRASTFWAKIPQNTQQWLGGLPEVFRGMAYFPVILRRADFARVRDHVAFVHGAPFNTVFQRLALPSQFSQFSIMLNVLFYTQRDAYAWNLQPFEMNNKTVTHPGQVSVATYEQLLRERGAPRVSGALHMPYLHKSVKLRDADALLREGYCTTTAPDSDPDRCGMGQWTREDSLESLFQFDDSLQSAYNGTRDALREHFETIEKMGYVYSQEQRALVDLH